MKNVTVVAFELHYLVVVFELLMADHAGVVDVEGQVDVRDALHAIHEVYATLLVLALQSPIAQDQHHHVADKRPVDYAYEF